MGIQKANLGSPLCCLRPDWRDRSYDMFDFVRNNTRILQLLLLVLILPSFVVFGIQGYSQFSDQADTVAKVGSQKVPQAEWDNAHRNAVERARAEQPDVDARLFDTPQFKQRSLEALVRQYVLAAAANDQHLTAADARVQRLFSTDPQFANLRNPDGTLNKAMLEARGMTANQFVGLLRQELTLSQVLSGVQNTGQTSRVSNRHAVEALFQVREVQWMKFEPKAYVAGLNPTADQLKTFYNDPANVGWLMAPEKADVQYVVLDLDSLKSQVSVSEDDLRRAYQENASRFSTPEERRASHILISVDPKATADQKKAARTKAEGLLAQARKNPAGFGELARANSSDEGSATNGGDLDFFGRGAMVKPFDEAVFKLKTGEISDLVESEFGFHIIKLTAVRGGQAKPFEEVRAQLEDDARKQLAQRLYAEAAEKFTNAVYEQSDSLKPVADELKLSVQSMSDVLRVPGAKDQGVLSNPRLLEALFDPANREKGRNTEAVEVGPSKLVSARIVKYSPAARLPYEAVEAQLRERWVAAEARKAARADADRKLAAWSKAPDQAQMPASVQISRRTVFNQPPAVMDAALRVPESQLPAWKVVDLGADGVALLKVIKAVPPQVSPQELQETEAQFGNYWGRAEADAYYRALKRQYKVEYLNEGKKVMDGSNKSAEQQKTDTPS
ncbi:peptidylprolyl isomerase [Aquabacterium olei]|uniref:Periplasmic chaperone PpiD n=2 Tax=Aquabacterium olei TaxID=1296669 RepID=A0A2U8FRY1_9BURK|nr:peptidylprolyl isomerase [Aquabacterium olei]